MIRNACSDIWHGIPEDAWILLGMCFGALIIFGGISLISSLPETNGPRTNCERLGGFYSTDHDTCTILKPGQDVSR